MYKIWYEVEEELIGVGNIPDEGYVYGYPNEYEDYCENLVDGEFLTQYENVAIYYLNILENLHPKTKYSIVRINV